jgi:hypothetical protein
LYPLANPSERGVHLQVHGFPKVMGVLTHLDAFRDTKKLKKTKKTLKHRFWSEIYQGSNPVSGNKWIMYYIITLTVVGTGV